ncbi:MAG TPA: hypothetical protein VHC98_03335 [Candidatus Saccharimonadales bacterium]|nr:hypothetical protein [Candidatus Saccharimonadales bacterium]
MRSIILSAVLLCLLAVVAGVLYVYLTDRSSAVRNQPQSMPVADSENAGVVKPVQPPLDAAEGVAIEVLTSPVAAGSVASLTARTNPGSTCTITATYNGAPSHAAGLDEQQADAYGTVSWTWTVDMSAPAGRWPVQVTCTYHGRAAVVRGDLAVAG